MSAEKTMNVRNVFIVAPRAAVLKKFRVTFQERILDNPLFFHDSLR